MNQFTILETLLEIRDVSLKLGDTQVLRGVNAEIRNIYRDGMTQGQVVSFLGPSGCGKTTLFRVLAGLQKPTTGEVFLTLNKVKQPIKVGLAGVVAQNYPLFGHRTVWGNLLVAGAQSGLTKEEAEAKADTLLKRFKLSDKAKHYASEVSGGQRQRIAIAQQLMCNTELLLMDEPFSGLDPIMKDEACHLIGEVAATDDSLTIIVVTHDIAAAVQVADAVWLMGREKNADGSPIPGAFIKEQINLAERGLAWHADVTSLSEYTDTCKEVRAKFATL